MYHLVRAKSCAERSSGVAIDRRELCLHPVQIRNIELEFPNGTLNDKEETYVILDEVSTRNYRGNSTLTTLSRTRVTTVEDSPTKEQLCLQDWRNKQKRRQPSG